MNTTRFVKSLLVLLSIFSLFFFPRSLPAVSPDLCFQSKSTRPLERYNMLPRFPLHTCGQVEPKYLSLQQELVRKMPRKGFGVFGGDPAQHARVNLMPVCFLFSSRFTCCS